MQSNIEIVIGKYLSGNASNEEKEQVENWITRSEANREEFEKQKRIWDLSLTLKKETEGDVETAWNEFRELTQKQEVRTILPLKSYRTLRIAAAVALFITMGLLLAVYVTDSNDSTELATVVVSPEPALLPEVPETTYFLPDSTIEPVRAEEQAKTKNTRLKKRVPDADAINMITVSSGDSARVFLLPDNSIVYLNKHSKLSYPENFSKNLRRVSLVGEAFFEVARDPKDSNLFVVSCQKTTTRGAGASSFNIRGYDEHKTIEVIVVSGRADFSGVGDREFKKLILNEGETGTFEKQTAAVNKKKSSRRDHRWWHKKNIRAKLQRFFERIKEKLTN